MHHTRGGSERGLTRLLLTGAYQFPNAGAHHRAEDGPLLLMCIIDVVILRVVVSGSVLLEREQMLDGS